MSLVFSTIAALDAALFIGLLVNFARIPGAPSSGGREMGMFFFGVVPLVILAAAAALFYFSPAPVWRYLALAVVAGPGLLYANHQIRRAALDHRVRQIRLGRGYFSASSLQSMGAAVVQGDVPALRRLAPGVDLNTVGDGGMTLVRLAAEQLAQHPEDPRARAVLQALIGLGASPDPALSTALKNPDPSLLRALLDAGANPNLVSESGAPVVFDSLAAMPVAHLQLLIDNGLNVEVMQDRTSLALTAALQRRFDLLLLLARHGADLRKPSGDGRTIGAEIADRLQDAKAAKVEPPAELPAIQAILDAQTKPVP